MSKVAWIFEGGAIRTMFTAGVADALMEKGLDFDGLFGVSAGALTGISLLSNQPGRAITVTKEYMRDPRYIGFRNLIFNGSIYNFDFLFNDICNNLLPLDYEAFYDNPRKFTAVVTNCRSGESEYFEKNECTDFFAAVRASSSLPFVSPMVPIGDSPYLDGGISDPIPFQRAIDEGYDKIILVLTRHHGFRKTRPSKRAMELYIRFFKNYPKLIQRLSTLYRMYNAQLDQIDNLEAKGRIFVIRPMAPVDLARLEKNMDKILDLYRRGRKSGEDEASNVLRYLAQPGTLIT